MNKYTTYTDDELRRVLDLLVPNVDAIYEAAARFERDSSKEHYDEGYKAGHDEGYKAGYREGYDEGYQEGFGKGYC
jgi:flagellar biosynthesis/type III secretory pathway protein FliH